MHEVGIVASTLEAAAVHAAGRTVVAVRLRIGALTGVVPAALQHAWHALRTGTLAEEARLDIEVVPGRCRCAGCGGEFASADLIPVCPDCGGAAAAVLAGNGLELASLELSSCALIAAAP